MYTVIIEDRNGRIAGERPLDQDGNYTIGRTDGNDITLPSNSVSRTHARIIVANNKCYIDDLGSSNGVLIGGVPCKERTEIRNGSRIKIGEYTLYLEYKDQNAMNNGQEILKTQIVSGEQSGYKLVRVGDAFAGEEFMLSEQNNTIGRTEDNYILVSDQSISRNHAKIVNTNMTFKVVDLNSSNGTYVNNRKLEGEQYLNSGDLIRFGNISFVFVPVAQNVDIRQYVMSRPQGSFPVIMIAIIIVLLIVAVAVFVYIGLNKEPKEDQLTTQEVQVSNEDKINSTIQRAEKHYNEKHFQVAHDLIDPLIIDNSDNQKLIELNSKINAELDNNQLLKDAEAAESSRKFDDAIGLLEKVDKSSMLYEEAQNKIKEIEHRKLIIAYNDARSKCDEESNVNCISNLCNVVKTLDPKEDKSKVEDAIQFLNTLTPNKKLAKKANECIKELNAMIK